MQQLVKARKEGDVVTLMTMYGEFVPDGDILLDSEHRNMLTICDCGN
ncbi:hypothetical protein LNM54_004402 [Salmonella enterica subsp. enterica]|nr:hypothetical protein [Salmonella enterica subsp. enterica]